MTSDVCFALRVSARRPGVPLVVAALFALAVGLASGMWAVIDAAVLRPLPYRDSRALVVVMEAHPQRGLMAITPANFLDWSTRVETLQDVAGMYAVDLSVGAAGLPERVAGTKVTERFFELWGVPPVAGRVLLASDFAAGRRVAVLSHALWTRQFGGDPRSLGALVRIDGEAYTVVGVMPASFQSVGSPEIWVPWTMSADERRERRFHLVGTMARLRSGRTAADARRELETIYRQLQISFPETTGEWSARIVPLRDMLLGDSARALAVLGGAVLVLVVVAWINVAGLLLAWLPTRRQEFLVRIAVGASTTRIVRQLLTEAVLWASAGTAGGLALAAWFVQLFGAVGVSTPLPYDFQPRVDGRVLLATAALLLVSVAVTALGPCVIAVHRSRDLVPRRASTTGGLARRITVAVQVALSIVLLSAAAGLLVGFQRLTVLARPAAGTGGLLAIDISRSETRDRDESKDRLFFERLLGALAGRREIRAVAAASYVPAARPLGNVRFSIEGRATSTEAQTALASAVSASAFRLLGVPLVRGRLIEDRDGPQAPYVAVISATLSRKYWPDENPIGRRIVLVGTDRPVTVVGVVGDVKQPLAKDPRAEAVLYVPYRQIPWPFMTLIVAPAVEPGAAAAALRQEVARLDPSQAAGSIRTLDDVRTEWLSQPRLQTTVVTIFGLTTLLLTLVGLYARVAHGVGVRVREFAIRQALGARPADVIRVLTRDALVVVACGICAGLALLPLTTRTVRSLTVDMGSLDIELVAAVACLLAIGAFASAYWPARRVGRIDLARLLTSDQ